MERTLYDYMNVIFIFETSHFYVLNYYYKKKWANVLIDKENNNLYRMEARESNQTSAGLKITGGIVNDLDGGIMFQPENYFEENGQEYMIELLYPYILKNYIASK